MDLRTANIICCRVKNVKIAFLLSQTYVRSWCSANPRIKLFLFLFVRLKLDLRSLRLGVVYKDGSTLCASSIIRFFYWVLFHCVCICDAGNIMCWVILFARTKHEACLPMDSACTLLSVLLCWLFVGYVHITVIGKDHLAQFVSLFIWHENINGRNRNMYLCISHLLIYKPYITSEDKRITVV